MSFKDTVVYVGGKTLLNVGIWFIGIVILVLIASVVVFVIGKIFNAIFRSRK